MKKNSVMKKSSQDNVEGKLHKVMGRIKEVTGIITDNPKLGKKGRIERLGGKIQEKIGQVKKVIGK